METPKQLLDTRVNVFLVHPRGRDKELKPFDRPGRRAEGSWTHGAACRPIRRALAAGKTLPGVRETDESSGMHARTPCRARAREAVEDADAAR